MIFLLWRSASSSRRTDLQRSTPSWVSKMCSLELLVRLTQMPIAFHVLAVFLRKMSRHHLSKGNRIAGVSYTFQLLECGLSTLSSLIPGINPSTETDQPRVEHVTLDSFNVILVFHKNFEGSANGSHGLIQLLHCSVKILLA